MHFTLLALSAVAAVAIPLDPAGGKVGAAQACDVSTCADVTGELQCIAQLIGGNMSNVRSCITGSVSQVCACINCNPLAALAFGALCGSSGGNSTGTGM